MYASSIAAVGLSAYFAQFLLRYELEPYAASIEKSRDAKEFLLKNVGYGASEDLRLAELTTGSAFNALTRSLKVIAYDDTFSLILSENVTDDNYNGVDDEKAEAEAIYVRGGRGRVISLSGLDNRLLGKALRLQRRAHEPCSDKREGSRDFVNLYWLRGRERKTFLSTGSQSAQTPDRQPFAECDDGRVKTVSFCAAGEIFDGKDCVAEKHLPCVFDDPTSSAVVGKRRPWTYPSLDPKAYYECRDNRAVKLNCAAGYFFDGFRCIASDPLDQCLGLADGTLVAATAGDNRLFRACRDGHAGDVRRCPVTEPLFCARLGKCVSRLCYAAPNASPRVNEMLVYFPSVGRRELSLGDELNAASGAGSAAGGDISSVMTLEEFRRSTKSRKIEKLDRVLFYRCDQDGKAVVDIQRVTHADDAAAVTRPSETATGPAAGCCSEEEKAARQWYASYISWCVSNVKDERFHPLHWVPVASEWMLKLTPSFGEAIRMNNGLVVLIRVGYAADATDAEPFQRCLVHESGRLFVSEVLVSADEEGRNKGRILGGRRGGIDGEIHGGVRGTLFLGAKAAENQWPYLPLEKVTLTPVRGDENETGESGETLVAALTSGRLLEPDSGHAESRAETAAREIENSAAGIREPVEYSQKFLDVIFGRPNKSLPMSTFSLKCNSETDVARYKVDVDCGRGVGVGGGGSVLTLDEYGEFGCVPVGQPIALEASDVSFVFDRRAWSAYFPVVVANGSGANGPRANGSDTELLVVRNQARTCRYVVARREPIKAFRSTWRSRDASLGGGGGGGGGGVRTYAYSRSQFARLNSRKIMFVREASRKRQLGTRVPKQKSVQQRLNAFTLNCADEERNAFAHNFLPKCVNDERCRNMFSFNGQKFASVYSESEAFACDESGNVLERFAAAGKATSDERPSTRDERASVRRCFENVASFRTYDATQFGLLGHARDKGRDFRVLKTSDGEEVKFNEIILPLSLSTLSTFPTDVWLDLPHLPLRVKLRHQSDSMTESQQHTLPRSLDIDVTEISSAASRSLRVACLFGGGVWDYEKDSCIARIGEFDSSLVLTEDVANAVFV